MLQSHFNCKALLIMAGTNVVEVASLGSRRHVLPEVHFLCVCCTTY
jgi:hypothetical protein